MLLKRNCGAPLLGLAKYIHYVYHRCLYFISDQATMAQEGLYDTLCKITYFVLNYTVNGPFYLLYVVEPILNLLGVLYLLSVLYLLGVLLLTWYTSLAWCT